VFWTFKLSFDLDIWAFLTWQLFWPLFSNSWGILQFISKLMVTLSWTDLSTRRPVEVERRLAVWGCPVLRDEDVDGWKENLAPNSWTFSIFVVNAETKQDVRWVCWTSKLDLSIDMESLQNRLLKVCYVPATSAGLPRVSFFFSFFCCCSHLQY